MNHSFNTDIANECGMEAAVILENIYFWCKKNEANKKLTDGKPWTYNSVKAFNEIFYYLSPSAISRALNTLETKGFIETGRFNTNAYDRTKWYCITDKAREYFEPKKESTEEPPKTDNAHKQKTDDCIFQNKNSISQNDESICQNEKWNSQNSQMNIADINTDNKPNINTDTPEVQSTSGTKSKKPKKTISSPPEKLTAAEKKKQASRKKANAINDYLSTLSDNEQNCFQDCVDTLYDSLRERDPSFARGEVQLLQWKYDFAQYSRKSGRSADEIYKTLLFAISDPFWQTIITSPKIFAQNYQKLYLKANQKQTPASTNVHARLAFDEVTDEDLENIMF